jgi:hypothetical protein
MSTNPNFRNPIVVWTTAQASPSGVAYANGHLFVAALRGTRVWVVPLNANGSAGTPVPELQGTFGRLRTVAAGPDGFLWVTTSNRDGRGSPVATDDRIVRVPAAGGPGPGTTVFADDFEAARGWVTNPNGTDTATSGQWARGNPETTTSGTTTLQLGTTVSGSNDLVTAAAAGTGAGANDVDGGTTSIQSPAITLPATGTLTLTFSWYLAHLNNATSADLFRVSVVTGATVTPVLTQTGAAQNRPGAWATATVNLTGSAGQTIRLRIEATDAATGSLIEAGVDDVRITAS